MALRLLPAFRNRLQSEQNAAARLIFTALQSSEPRPTCTVLRFSKKNCIRLITSWTPPHMQVLGSFGSNGACLRVREIVTLRRLFFFFKVPCASLQVGPLDRSSPLTAQMTRPGGVCVLFMVSLIKKLSHHYNVSTSWHWNDMIGNLHVTTWYAASRVTQKIFAVLDV